MNMVMAHIKWMSMCCPGLGPQSSHSHTCAPPQRHQWGNKAAQGTSTSAVVNQHELSSLGQPKSHISVSRKFYGCSVCVCSRLSQHVAASGLPSGGPRDNLLWDLSKLLAKARNTELSTCQPTHSGSSQSCILCPAVPSVLTASRKCSPSLFL